VVISINIQKISVLRQKIAKPVHKNQDKKLKFRLSARILLNNRLDTIKEGRIMVTALNLFIRFVLS